MIAATSAFPARVAIRRKPFEFRLPQSRLISSRAFATFFFARARNSSTPLLIRPRFAAFVRRLGASFILSFFARTAPKLLSTNFSSPLYSRNAISGLSVRSSLTLHYLAGASLCCRFRRSVHRPSYPVRFFFGDARAFAPCERRQMKTRAFPPFSVLFKRRTRALCQSRLALIAFNGAALASI